MKQINNFGELYVKYYPYALSVAFKLTHSSNSSQDLVQDSFLKIYNNFHKYDSSKPFGSWLYAIIKNTFLDNFRKTSKQNFEYIQSHKEIQDPNLNPEDFLLRIEEITLSQKFIGELPKEKQDVLELRLQGNSFPEISNLLKIPCSTLRWRVQSSVASLRQKVREVYSFGKNHKL